MSKVGQFGGVIGSRVFGVGSTCEATALDETILDTEAGSLLGMYSFKQPISTAANNPGLSDSSGNGATAIHNDPDDLLGNVQRVNSEAGNIGCCYEMLDGGRFGWGAPIPGGSLPDSFTLLGFFRWTAEATISPVAFVDWDAGSNNPHVAIHLAPNGTITFDAFISGTGLVDLAVASETVAADGWHMLAATYDNATSSPRLYLDGVEITPASTNSISGTTPVSHMTPGSASRSAEYYTSARGCMGPCAFWETALTAEQVGAIWNAAGVGEAVATGLQASILNTHSGDLVAYYPLDDAAGSTVADASGNGNDLTVSGSPTFGVAGPSGDAMYFDATATPEQYAAGVNPFTGGSEMPGAWTVFWITRRDTEEAANQTFYWALGDTVDGVPIAGAFNGTAITPDAVRWLIRGDDNEDDYHLTSTFEHEDLGLWHCYAMTYDGTSYRFYVNGTEDVLRTKAHNQGQITVDQFAINWLPGTNDNGKMIQYAQHYALWERALTWREIRDLYFAACGEDDAGLLGQLTRSADDLIEPTNAYTDAVLSDGGTLFRLSEPGGHWFFDDSDNLGDATAGGAGPAPGLFSSKLASANFTHGSDARSGPVNGGTYQSHTGNSDIIEYPPALLDAGNLPFTIEFWLRLTSFPGNRTVFSFGSAANPYIRLRQVLVGGNDLRLQINDGTNSTNSGQFWPDLTNWHHVVLVIESGGARYYIDGVKHTQTQTWTAGAFGAINKLHMNGRTGDDGTTYNEKTDLDVAEIAFYPGVALSDAEVSAHYTAASDPPG